MTPSFRRTLLFYAVLAFGIAAVLIFPRIGAFASLAARELRLFWWLIVIGGIVLYLAFKLGRRRD